MSQNPEDKRRSSLAQVITTTQLGCCLVDGGQLAGETFEPEPGRGRRLLEFAARQGDLGAMLQLASRLISGRGLAKDPELARDWLAEACQRGSAEARASMGRQLPPRRRRAGHSR